MIYVKNDKEVKPKTYHEMKQLEKQGYKLKIKKKKGRPPKVVSE